MIIILIMITLIMIMQSLDNDNKDDIIKILLPLKSIKKYFYHSDVLAIYFSFLNHAIRNSL